MKPKFKLVAGLGNPTREHRMSYHNAGRLFVAYLLGRSRRGDPKCYIVTPSSSRTFRFARCGARTLLFPTVFMNESGEAIRDALRYFRTNPEELLVAHDDADILLGSYKCAFGRGSAGHRGVSSVIDALGTRYFFRLRIGIRTRQGKAGEFVLRPLPEEARQTLYSMFSEIAENVIEKESFC